MRKIKYEDINGKILEFEVLNELADEYEKLLKKERLNNRKETRRHESFKDEKHGAIKNFEEDFLCSLDIQKFNKIIMVLRPRDRKLFKLHYLNGVSIKTIAKNQKVTASAIRKKLRRIKKKIHELWLK